MALDETMNEPDNDRRDFGPELALTPFWNDYTTSAQDEVLPFLVFDNDDGEDEDMDDEDNFDDMDDDFDDDFEDEDDDYEDEDEDYDYEEDVDYDDFDE